MRSTRWLGVAVGALTAWGCGGTSACGDGGEYVDGLCTASKDEVAGADTAAPDDEVPAVTTRAVGLIVRESGSVVEGATVSGAGHSTTSDSGGRFEIALPGSGTTVLVVEKVGFAPTYRQVSPGGAAMTSVGITLHTIDTTGSVEASAGGSVPIVDSLIGATIGSVEVPPNAFVTADTGVPVASGSVEIALTWVGPAEVAAGAPVDMVGTDGLGTWPLISYGMVDVTARWDGQRCALGAGQVLVLHVQAAPGAPDSAGLFSADMQLGQWVLEGAAVNSGTEWTASIPHLSWWNVDAFFKVPAGEQCCLNFAATRPNGKPASGVEIRGTIPGGGTFGGNTEFDGTLCDRRFPCDGVVSATWRVLTGAPYSGKLSVVPSARGADCYSGECEVVAFTVPCVFTKDCSAGQTCETGLCVGGIDADVVGPHDIGGDDASVCTPSCEAGQCSDNGCGQPCAACGDGQTCGPAGVCVACVANCTGKLCGDDGCGGSCGICPAGSSCTGVGQCGSPCDFCPSGACNAFGFEGANVLSGWDISGDVVVIPQLGGTSAPEGTQMLRLSTGLSTDAPSYAQKALCASPGITTLTFRWRLYSEEFEEYCGSTYQDYFTVSLDSGGARTELLHVTIDDLCPAGTNGCTTCGALGSTLTPADVAFDKGGVLVAPWQTATLPLPAGASTGTLIFEVRDIGDSAYDTVVLIDAVNFGG